MRTTITIDDHLLLRVKQAAAESGRTMGQVIEDALRASLARESRGPTTGRIDLPTDGSGGLQPGVDLDDSAALLELMERDDRPR